MKNRNLIMMFFLLIISAGCSKNTQDEEIVENDTILPVISALEEEHLDQSILSFFNKELPQNRYENSKGFFTSIAEDQEDCIIINSEEEFQNAYNGDYALPTIDFQHYTLILGKLYEDASYLFQGQYLTKEGNGYSLVLCFRRESAVADMLPFYYWGIYPRINNGNVTVKKEIMNHW